MIANKNKMASGIQNVRKPRTDKPTVAYISQLRVVSYDEGAGMGFY